MSVLKEFAVGTDGGVVTISTYCDRATMLQVNNCARRRRQGASAAEAGAGKAQYGEWGAPPLRSTLAPQKKARTDAVEAVVPVQGNVGATLSTARAERFKVTSGWNGLR